MGHSCTRRSDIPSTSPSFIPSNVPSEIPSKLQSFGPNSSSAPSKWWGFRRSNFVYDSVAFIIRSAKSLIGSQCPAVRKPKSFAYSIHATFCCPHLGLVSYWLKFSKTATTMMPLILRFHHYSPGQHGQWIGSVNLSFHLSLSSFGAGRLCGRWIHLHSLMWPIQWWESSLILLKMWMSHW